MENINTPHEPTIENLTITPYSELTPQQKEEIINNCINNFTTKTIKEYDDGRVELIITACEGVLVGVMTDRTLPRFYINDELLRENEELRNKYVNYPVEA